MKATIFKTAAILVFVLVALGFAATVETNVYGGLIDTLEHVDNQ